MHATRKRGAVARLAGIAALGALTLSLSVSPAAAATTIGQLAPGATAGCGPNSDWVQPTVTSGNSYVVPATGGIVSWAVTSWSHNAGPGAGQTMGMKVYRPVSGSTYTVVGHDGPRDLTPSAPNTFPANLEVKPGDVLGLHSATGGPGCVFGVTGESTLTRNGDLADGESGSFSPINNSRLNIAAEITPTNAFTLGKTTRDRKKGTATVEATVPNPGELTGSGKGVKAAGAAVISKTVSPGETQLRIKAKGKKRRKLNETGKVKLKVGFTFTPTGGDPRTRSEKVKLKKKL